MLIIDNVSKVYRSRYGEVHALDGLSFQLDAHDFLTVTGSSGSGKTTLLLCIGGLIHPTKGRILCDGFNLYSARESELASYRNKKVGFVLQTFNLIPYLDALQNILVPMIVTPHRNGNLQDRAEELLKKVGLYERRYHLPRELSVGQQQRVAIARALANNPDIILADEPTGNLDPSLSREILQIFKQLNEEEGKSIIMVTHSPEAAKFGSKQLRLKDGKIETIQTLS